MRNLFLLLALWLILLVVDTKQLNLNFRACTENPYRFLFCIDNCSHTTDTDDFYALSFLVFDLQTGLVSEPTSSDKPIACPDIDDRITRQSMNRNISSTCQKDLILWKINYSNVQYNVSTHVSAKKNESSLWYNSFYFLTSLPKQTLYFVVEGGNHNFHQGMAIYVNENVEHDWYINLVEGEPGLSTYAFSSVGYDFINETVPCRMSEMSDAFYPILFEEEQLAAFPGSGTVWYFYNDTGLYPLAKGGIMDIRIESIIDISGMIINLYSYKNHSKVSSYDVTLQLERYHVKRIVPAKPSIIVLVVSFVTIVALVVAEIITKRNQLERKKKEESEIKELELKKLEKNEIELSFNSSS